jgi:ubiquinone/menaquinone biosynthesis C-methylase UbiE
MSLIEVLVKQSGKPYGTLGRIMVKIMNQADSGLNKWIVEKINCPSGTVLDIGCGGGQSIFNLLNYNKVNHMIGIDFSLDSVNVAKKKNAAFINSKRAEIIQANVTALPYLDNFFDIIMAVRSHYFWNDYDKAFAEIYRTLKQGGKMILFSERYKIQYHMKMYNTDESMASLLKTIGFDNIKIENKDAVQCIIAEKTRPII